MRCGEGQGGRRESDEEGISGTDRLRGTDRIKSGRVR